MSATVSGMARLVFSVMAVTAFFALAYAGPKVFDKNVPIEQSAFLCFDKDTDLSKINGKGLGIGGIQVVKGAGSQKKPQVIYQVPAGECTLKGTRLSSDFEVTSELQAGRYYLIVEKTDATAGEVAKSTLSAMGGKVSVELKDVTDIVKK